MSTNLLFSGTKPPLVMFGRNVSDETRRQVIDAGYEIVPASLASFMSSEPFTEPFHDRTESYQANVQLLRNRHVVLIDSTAEPMDGSAFSLLQEIDTLKYYGVKHVSVVMPFVAFGRQDRAFPNRFVSVTGELYPRLLREAGADQVVTMALHSKASCDFYEKVFGKGFTHLDTIEPFSAALQARFGNTQDLVFGAPDGADKPHDMAQSNARQLAASVHGIDAGVVEPHLFKIAKQHTGVNDTKIMDFQGDVAGKDCVLFDDMIDGGGTTINAATRLKQQGARSVIACTTHGILSNSALQRLYTEKLDGNRVVDHLMVADTLPHLDRQKTVLKTQYPQIDEFVTSVPLAPLVTQAIETLHEQAPRLARTGHAQGGRL